MTPKFMNFLAQVWFMSVLVCLVIEGSQVGTTDTNIINQLTSFSAIQVGGIAGFFAGSLAFFQGIFNILTWNYSFYEGSWQILRYFWLVTLTPGAIWGMVSVFAPVVANLIRWG